jgi:hypothetical protein
MAQPWEMDWGPQAAAPASSATAPAASDKAPWEMDWAPPEEKKFGLSDTWPAQLAKGVYRAVTLPGEGYQGKLAVQPEKPGWITEGDISNQDAVDQDIIHRSFDLAGVASPASAGSKAVVTPAVPRPVPPAPANEIASAGSRIGVDVPKGIATDSPLAAFTAQVIAKAPGGGPLTKAVEESRNSLQGAVSTAANKAGGVIDPAMAGDNYASAIENSFKPTVKSGVSAAYDNVAALMDKSKLTELSNTQGAVADILARRGESAIDGLGKAVDTVSEGIKRPGGMTFDGIKGLRTHLGEMLDSGVFPEGMSEGELRRLYGSLSDDLKAAALNSGGERGVAALERANELNKQVSDWKEGIKKVLGPETRSGEGVSSAILRMASDGSSADIETLAKARSAVPKEVWQDIASTAISRLGKSRNGEWTPAAFVTDFRQLSDRGKALLFRSVGSGDVLPFLDDIAKVSQKFVDRGKLANTSGTAGHNALYAVGGAIATGLAHLSFVEPLTAVAGIAGINGTARLLARPATASSVAKWSRVYDRFAVAQTPATRSALTIASGNLANTAAANGVKFNPADLMRAVQSPAGVAADDQQPNVPGRIRQ